MRRWKCYGFLLVWLWMGCAGSALAATPKLDAKGKAFVMNIVKGKFQRAYATLSPRMATALPLERLKMMWTGLQLQLGPFASIVAVKVKKIGPYNAVLLTCAHENGAVRWRVVYDKNKKVAGLQFLPAKAPTTRTTKKPARVPPYARRSAFVEKPVTIGPFKLKGTLSLPKGVARAPAVVLVHGSGPHDQDETIGPNKVFRDLAWGLASHNIAVLRYTKRTKALAPKLKKNKALLSKMHTVEGEVIEDAAAAVALLARRPEVDSSRIYVLGHSLGGTLAPAIARRASQVAGLILMAGASRPLEELVLDQYLYLFTLDGKVTVQERKLLRELLGHIVTLRSGLTKTTPRTSLPLNIPAPYWISLRRNNPVKVVARMDKPILVLQGGRDYQVTQADLDLWKKTLRGRDNVRYRFYPSLNHLFISGKGKSQPSEYAQPGFVAVKVIKDIARWLHQTTAGTPPTTRPATRPANR